MHAFVRRISVAAFGALPVWVVPLQSATAGVDRWTTRGPSGANVTSVALSPSDPSTVYLGVDSPSVDFGSGVYKSSDGGQRWDLLDMGVLQDHITKVAVDPSSADIVYAGTHGSGVLKSADGGSHWHRIWWQYNTEINALVVDPLDTQTIYAAAD